MTKKNSFKRLLVLVGFLLHPKTGNFSRLFTYMRVIRNWPEYILYRIGAINQRKSIYLVLRNGQKIKFKLGEEGQFRYYTFKNLLEKGGFLIKKINKTECLLTKKDLKILTPFENLSVIYANFIRGEYKSLDTKQKIVVDLGANIGDTPLYFLKNGAMQVIAFEPNNVAFNFLVKNIKLNHLQNKCIAIRAAVGTKSEYIKIKSGQFSLFSSVKNIKNGLKTKIFTLDEIIKRFNLKDAVLKIDIEGREESIINKSSIKTLRAFGQIIIESNSKSVKEKLKLAGFKVKNPFLHPDIIYAVRSKELTA